ncbi:hypothetical protein AwDysgo_06780 [Bacteroidales bacterium]|nr:hypothetical protein AwDysgo_06780 [Bacteroidales bacterium]
MKIIRLCILTVAMLAAGTLCAENYKTLLVLDNYTIPTDLKGAKIGRFIMPQKETISILKDASELFEISENRELRLRRNKIITATSAMSYLITVQYGNKQKTFEIVKDDFIKNKVVAHRGAWKNSGASQNTLGALQYAIDLGCQASEFDVWMTKDKRIAVNHDADLQGLIIEKRALADLQQIKLNNNEIIPTLEDYIHLIKGQNKTRIVLELKSNKGNDNILALADSCVQIVHRMNAQAWVDYISFDYRGLKLIRSMDPTAHTSFLEHSVDLDLQKIDAMSGIDYHFSLYDKIEKLHERCKMLKLTMNAWTVNDQERMEHFLDMDIDFITSDEPEMLLKIIELRKQ